MEHRNGQPFFLLVIYLVLKSLNPKPGWGASRSYDTDSLIQTLQQLDTRAEVNMSTAEREGGNVSEGPATLSVGDAAAAPAATASVHTTTQPRPTPVNLELVSRDTSQEPSDRDAEG
jgi:hypothetical protein